MSSERKVLVIGAGIGGLTLATALGQRGFTVDVVEQRPDNSVAGVGINQPPNAMRVARDLAILDECLQHGFPIRERAIHDHHGRVLVEDVLSRDAAASNGISRRDLNAILLRAAERAGAKLYFGMTVTRHEDDGASVKVEMSDGRSVGYSAVVCFDGIHSAMRRELFGVDHEPVHTGYAALRVTLPRSPEVWRILQFIGPENKAGLIPISQSEMYLFLVVEAQAGWRPAPHELAALLRQELEPYSGMVARLREEITPGSSAYFSPIEEVYLPEPWYRGRIIVVGDAAHASAPHLTQGGAQAQEDAIAIADALDEDSDVERAFAAAMSERTPRSALSQRVSHEILMGEMNRDPEHRKLWPDRFRELIAEASALTEPPGRAARASK